MCRVLLLLGYSESRPVSEPILELRGVSKKYARDLRRSRKYGVASMLGELRHPRSSHVVQLHQGEFFALEDISFELAEGEALGVLGPNGAGKSTLLQLAGELTLPEVGSIMSRSRVATLLDLNCGFDPILTGRENLEVVYALMTGRSASDQKVSEIVETAELDRFIDSPLRTFSQGMRLRLGFSIMVNCDAELLVIDEALAVGDTLFQLQCLDRLRAFCRAGGSILFATHSMFLFQMLANRGIYLQLGRIVAEGDPFDVADRYLADIQGDSHADTPSLADPLERELVRPAGDPPPEEASPEPCDSLPELPSDDLEFESVDDREVQIDSVRVQGPGGGTPTSSSRFSISVVMSARHRVESAYWGFDVRTSDMTVGVLGHISRANPERAVEFALLEGEPYEVRFECNDLPLAPGRYLVRVAVINTATSEVLGLHGYEDAPTFFEVLPIGDSDVGPSATDHGFRGRSRRPLMVLASSWSTEPA